MAIVVPNVSELDLLDGMTGNGGFDISDAVAHLFVNNYTPIATTVLGDFTEASWTGYAPANLDPWGAAATDASGRAESVSSLAAFFNTSASNEPFFGYYVTDSPGTTLLFAERLGSLTMNAGAGRALLVRFTLAQA